MSTTLEAGPELDAAVAAAIGAAPCAECKRINERGVVIDGACHSFKPSESIEDAFKAAEKCGLFHDVDVKLSKNHHAGWTVESLSPPEQYNAFKEDPPEIKIELIDIGTGPTPALAICRAILKLKGAPTSTESAPGEDVSPAE